VSAGANPKPSLILELVQVSIPRWMHPILSGREISVEIRHDGPPRAAVVNDAFVQTFFREQGNPVWDSSTDVKD
jgi:hypothetical protein